MNPRIVFIGTSEFAVPSLRHLAQSEHNLVAVITQPAKEAGRGMNLQQSPVGILAQEKGLTLMTPSSIREASQEILDTYQPDLIIVAAYGQFVPDNLLNTPKFGAINIHGSVLPLLRGAIPIQKAILDGFARTGISIQKMVKKMDAGDVYAQSEVDIDSNDTAGTLGAKLAELSVGLLQEILPKIFIGEVIAKPQDESEVTFCYARDAERSAAEVKFEIAPELALRMIRAFNPAPIAWFMDESRGHLIKIYKAQLVNNEANEKFELIRVGKQLRLKLKTGTLEIQQLQFPGKPVRDASEYLSAFQKVN